MLGTMFHSQEPIREYTRILYVKSNLTSVPLNNQEGLEKNLQAFEKTCGSTQNIIRYRQS